MQDWNRQGSLGQGITFTTEMDDVRQHGEAAIKQHIRPYIHGAGAVLVLVGDDTHKRSWIDYEVAVALSERRRVIPVRIPNTYGAAPLDIRNFPLVAWDPASLRVALQH